VPNLLVGQAAERLSQVEPYADTPPSYFAAQLRDFIQRGLVQPIGYKGTGSRRAALLDAERLCVARLLSILTRLGLRSEQLARTTRLLEKSTPRWFGGEPPPGYEGNSDTPGGLPSAVVRGIKAGGTWYFRLWVEPVAEGTGGIGQMLGGFHEEEPGIGGPIRDAYPVIVINVTRLFGPLLVEEEPPDDPAAEQVEAA
jgi:hypothetical protein